MRTALQLFCLVVLLTIGSASASFSCPAYRTFQIICNPYPDSMIGHQMSPAGRLAWEAWDGSDIEIFLHDGIRALQLTNNDYDDHLMEVNDLGHVAWMGSDGTGEEIFLYDGSDVVQITNADYLFWDFSILSFMMNAQMNNADQIVWCGYREGHREVGLYHGSGVSILDSNADYYTAPQINETGQVVWSAQGTTGHEVFLYDSGHTATVTNGEYLLCLFPQLNTNGLVVWDGVTDWDVEFWHQYLSV